MGGDQLALSDDGHELVGMVPARDRVTEMLERAGIRGSSVARYRKSARSWLTYCADRGIDPANADTTSLVAWLDSRVRGAESPRSVIRIALSAASAIQAAEMDARGEELDPTPYRARSRPHLARWVKAATMDVQPPKRAKALRLGELVHVVNRMRAYVQPRGGVSWERAVRLSRRDVAAVLVGWWAGARADDLSHLTWRNVAFVPDGVELTFERHKTSRRTGPRTVALARKNESRAACPVLALQEWATETAFEHDERVFELTSAHLHRMLTQALRTHGAVSLTPHSLRAGFATECAAQRVPDSIAMEHARWLSVQQYREYVRLGRLWVDNPTAMLSVPEEQ